MLEMRKFILFISKNCKPCKDAIKDLLDITIEAQIPVGIVDVNTIDKNEIEKYNVNEILVPTLCLVDDDKVRECIVGYSTDYKDRIKELIK